MSALFTNGDYHERKEQRRQHYERHVKGWKLQTCTACSGSGFYDHNGSPRCGGCNGTGKMRAEPHNRPAPPRSQR